MNLDSWPRKALLLSGFLLLAPLLLGTLTQLASHFLGIEYVDHYGTQWFYWYLEHQLRQGDGLEHTDLFFFPWGKDVFLHTGSNVLDAIFALPFRFLFGNVLGYNLFVLAATTASGLAIYRLMLAFTDDRVSAGAAALLVAVSPYVLIELAEGRPTQAFLGFPALFLLYSWRSGIARGLRAPLLAGVMLALAGYQYWFYAFFGGMVVLAHGLWRAAFPPDDAGERGDSRARILARHALIAAVALTLCLPVALPLIQASAGGEVPGLLDADLWSFSQALPVTKEGENIGLFLWQPLKGHTGFYAINDDGTEQFMEHGALTPWIALVAGALWLLRPGRAHRGPLVAMYGTATVLSLGPIFILGNGYLPNVPYIALVKSFAFLQRLWWPARAYAYTDLLYGVAFAVTFTWLGARSRGVQAGAILASAALWLLHARGEALVPFPTWDATVPAGYSCLATGEEGAIIELPFSWTQAHLYYQTEHGRPILGGMIENNPLFAPEEAVALREDNSFVAALLAYAKMEGIGDQAWTETDKAAVKELGYRYVVLQRDAFAVPHSDPGLADNALKTRLRRMRRNLSSMVGNPVYEDARINIYAPWGDASPCTRDQIEPDTVALGRTDMTPGLRAFKSPEEVSIRGLVPAPPIPASNDAEEEATEASGSPSAEPAPAGPSEAEEESP